MSKTKTQIRNIVILAAEGPIGRVPFGGLFLDTWEAAEAFVRKVASEVADRRGFCDKVHFQLNYADDFVYQGRIDVTAGMRKGTPLADHVRMFNLNRSGRGTASPELLRAHDSYDPDGRGNAARMLDEYQIGQDEAEPPAEAPACPVAAPPVPVAIVDPMDGIGARIRALPESKRAALLGMLAALEG